MISHEIFDILCWIWIAVAVVIFPILLKVTQLFSYQTTSMCVYLLYINYGIIYFIALVKMNKIKFKKMKFVLVFIPYVLHLHLDNAGWSSGSSLGS